MKTVKNYTVSTDFSKRNIQARSKKEAIELFKLQLGVLISANDKITVR